MVAQAHGAKAWEYRPRRPEETLLHRVVVEHWATFVAREEQRGGRLPGFVDGELRKFVRCGVLGHGFVRVRCASCGHDRAVPFACKGRGFCPSCGGRRMAETAARLVDRVLPRAPIRQWVLSLPRPLRYRLAYDASLCSAVLRVFLRAVFGWTRRRARKAGVLDGRPGAVTFVQRFGSAINLNLHLHSLVLDGVYDGAARFHPLPPPTPADIDQLCAVVARRVRRLLSRRGLDDDSDPLADDEPLLAGICSAAIQGTVATGDRAGAAVARVVEDVDDEPTLRREPLCADVAGFSLEAGVAVPARDRKRLEHLVRYVARPPIAGERLSLLHDGRIAYQLKKKWTDGTTHMIFRPTELMEKLVALTPAPQKNLTRYHGVLAARARLRPLVVADARPPPGVVATEGVSAPDGDRAASADERLPEGVAPAIEPPSPLRPDRYMPWAELLRRVFEIDVLCCPRCGGRMKILATITEPSVVAAFLRSLGLSPDLPRFAPARSPPRPPELDFSS